MKQTTIRCVHLHEQWHLPQPLKPTRAVVCPPRAMIDKSRRADIPFRAGYVKLTWSNSISPFTSSITSALDLFSSFHRFLSLILGSCAYIQRIESIFVYMKCNIPDRSLGRLALLLLELLKMLENKFHNWPKSVRIVQTVKQSRSNENLIQFFGHLSNQWLTTRISLMLNRVWSLRDMRKEPDMKPRA